MLVYIATAVHHVLHEAIPSWLQIITSLMLIIILLPSARIDWKKFKINLLFKFLILAYVFYIVSSVEVSMQIIKSVSAFTIFTSWLPGTIDASIISWVSFVIFACLFHMIPRIYGREIYSESFMRIQLWLQSIGLVLYFIPMWVLGMREASNWNTIPDNDLLIEAFEQTISVYNTSYTLRVIGVSLFLVGILIWSYHVYKTITSARVLTREPKNYTPMAP
jgi:cytochrome c oxidase cbb3-type subunit 1